MKSNYNYKVSTFYINGKQYKERGKTQKEADQKAALKKKQLESGEVGVSNNMSVRNWCDVWIETYKQGTVAEKTLRECRRYVGMVCNEIGGYRLKDVKDVHLQEMLNKMQGKSTSDTRKYRIAINSIFSRAVKSRLIPYNPADDLALPLTVQGKRRSITDVERELILQVAETHGAGLWVKTMLYCGLRPGEVMALRWCNVDFVNRRLCVVEAKESGSARIKSTKTAAGVRDVPIPAPLLSDFKKAKGLPFDNVFVKPQSGKPHNEKSFYAQWRSFKREMNIQAGVKVYRNKLLDDFVAPDLSPYCLRHTFCTDLQAADVGIDEARRLMGHSDISVTSNIYTHYTDEMMLRVAQKMDSFHAQKVAK